MTYHLRIDQLRAAAAAAGDTTGTAIAERVGISQPAVSRLLRGKTQPGFRTLLLLRQAYEMSESDLIEEAA